MRHIFGPNGVRHLKFSLAVHMPMQSSLLSTSWLYLICYIGRIHVIANLTYFKHNPHLHPRYDHSFPHSNHHEYNPTNTFHFQNKQRHQAILDLILDHNAHFGIPLWHWRNPTDGTQRDHLWYPRSHHTQYPNHTIGDTLPLVLCLNYLLLEVWFL